MKDFVPYEQALELKELGFDEPCFGYYEDTGLTITFPSTSENGWKWVGNSIVPTKNTSAPTYSQAFRFFREKYGLEIILRPDAINAPEKKLREYVILSYDESWILEPIAEPQWWIRKGLFETYEEAELQCLQRLIKIVKNK